MQGSGDRSEKAPGRLLAVGDIHGCLDELSVLLDAIQPTSADKIVFLGDYVDRGPSPRGVIDLLIALRDSRRCQTVFLRGNHEDMFLDFIGERGRHGEAFLFNGGRITLASYGLPPVLAGDEVRVQLPEPHLEFLRGLELRHLDEPFLFVHAGVSPIRPFAEQNEEDLLWIRDEFIRNRHPFSQTDRLRTHATAGGAVASSVQDRSRHRLRVRKQTLVSRFHFGNTLAGRARLSPRELP